MAHFWSQKLVSSLTINKSPFCGLFSVMFLHFCFLLMISLFKMAPKCSNEMVSTVAMCKKAVMYFTGQIGALGMRPLSASYMKLVYRFNVNNQQYILKVPLSGNTHKHT